MKKKENIVSYSAAELEAMRKRGEDKTDWARLDAMTEQELEASIDDEDDIGSINWENVVIGMPQRKRDIHIRLDADLIDWLKQNGRGYQTRINAILRAAYKAAHGHKTQNNHTP